MTTTHILPTAYQRCSRAHKDLSEHPPLHVVSFFNSWKKTHFSLTTCTFVQQKYYTGYPIKDARLDNIQSQYFQRNYTKRISGRIIKLLT